MNFESKLNPRIFRIDIDDAIIDDSNSLEIPLYNNNNYNNNDSNTFFESTKNKLFEIEINEINNYNKNLEFLSNSINIKSNKEIKFISKKAGDTKNNKENQNKYVYRKDAYYKHFKSLFAKYIKDKANKLKNICFPHFDKNNFFAISYKYTGNPKEKDNLNFLLFTIKDILIYGKDKEKYNRQFNNEQLIKYIEDNENKTNDKEAYVEIIQFLNLKLEDVIMQYYDEEKEFNKITNCKKYIYFDKFFKRETGISLLEKYGFLKALKKNDSKNTITEF